MNAKSTCCILTVFYFVTVFISCTCRKSETDSEIQATNNIREYLIKSAREITGRKPAYYASLKEWEEVRPQRYHEFTGMLSLDDMPLEGERPPLNVQLTGTVQREGYRIEKLYYESLPGLYVPANLYIPENLKGPAPAILYVCGHSMTQKVHYQTHPAKFARLGFVCLIIETIQWGEVLGQHHGCYARGWFNWYSRGYTPAGVEVWNAIRGLDLLSERPEVDGQKMGVTGISGGGAQSWFIAAADPRIRAAAPVCGASTLEDQIFTRTIDGHCDCMMPVNTFRIDFRDIGALIAPRPLLIGQSDRDGLNRVESVRRIYDHLKPLYQFHSASGNLEYVETPGGHSYHPASRTKIFSFFMAHLMGKNVAPGEAGDIDESPGALLSEDDLRVYTSGPPAGDKTTTIQDSFLNKAVAPEIETEEELKAYRDSVKEMLSVLSFGAFPDNPPPYEPELVFRTLDRARYGSDIYSFVPEKGWRLKVDFRWQNDPSEKKPLLIVLRNSGEKRGESESSLILPANNPNLAYLEVRGVGETGWSPELNWHVRRAAAWTGRTIASMQVYDLLRCIGFCRTLQGVDASGISIAARDEMSVVALYAALLDGKCSQVFLQNPPQSQDEPSSPDGRGPSTEILNCLKVTDLWQLPALLYPTRVSVAGHLPEKYKWSETVLEKIGKPAFITSSGQDQNFSQVSGR